MGRPPLDWPTANAKRGSLMKGYAALLKTMREKLDRASAADGRYYLLISLGWSRVTDHGDTSVAFAVELTPP